jgi:hypothetical protein
LIFDQISDEFFFGRTQHGTLNEFNREEGDIELPQRAADLRVTSQKRGRVDSRMSSRHMLIGAMLWVLGMVVCGSTSSASPSSAYTSGPTSTPTSAPTSAPTSEAVYTDFDDAFEEYVISNVMMDVVIHNVSASMTDLYNYNAALSSTFSGFKYVFFSAL